LKVPSADPLPASLPPTEFGRAMG